MTKISLGQFVYVNVNYTVIYNIYKPLAYLIGRKKGVFSTVNFTQNNICIINFKIKIWSIILKEKN